MLAILLALAITLGTFYLDELRRVWLHHLPMETPNFGNLFVSFPECLIFMHGMVPGSEMPAFNPPLWTLTPEVQLYLAFPILVVIARWRGTRVGGKWPISGLGLAVMLAVGACVAYRVWLYYQIGYATCLDDDSTFSSEYHCLTNTFLGRWAEFAFGMGATSLVVRERTRSPYLLLPAFCLCLSWFLVLRSDLAIGGWIGRLFLAMEPAPSPLADEVGGAAFALLILCCATIPWISQLFSWRPLVTLGTLAYSLYLVHIPVLYGLQWTMKMLLRRELVTTSAGSLPVFAMNMLIGLPLALLAARLFWSLCERPFLSQERRTTLKESLPSRD
ncbi:MAG: acyltransferase [Armatimonas sp.]